MNSGSGRSWADVANTTSVPRTPYLQHQRSATISTKYDKQEEAIAVAIKIVTHPKNNTKKRSWRQQSPHWNPDTNDRSEKHYITTTGLDQSRQSMVTSGKFRRTWN